MEYYSSLKNKEILSYATTWKKLKNIMLSETGNKLFKNNMNIWIHLDEVSKVVKYIETK